MPKKRTDGLVRGERLQIMLSPQELSLVDDFRFRNRMPSRAAAVRELFRLGLTHAEFDHTPGGKKSADYGVIGGEAGLSGEPGE